MSDSGQHELKLVVGGFDGDLMAISDASTQLLEELSLLDFDQLDRALGEEPIVGTRSADAVAIGALVGLLLSPVALRTALDVVKSWLVRQERGSVTVTYGKDKIVLTAASGAEQEALVEAFLKKHARP
jgi:hypothetical protein